MDQQGPGQPVRVQLPSGSQVLHAQPLGRLDSNLAPLVGPGVVGGADPVAHPPPGEEVLAGCGGEHLGTIRCEVLGAPYNMGGVIL